MYRSILYSRMFFNSYYWSFKRNNFFVIGDFAIISFCEFFSRIKLFKTYYLKLQYCKYCLF